MSNVDWVLYVHTAWDRIQVRQSPSGTVPMECQVDTPYQSPRTASKNMEQEKSKREGKKKKKISKLKSMTNLAWKDLS